MGRKILYTSGLGGGWTTWNNEESKELAAYLLSYQPIVDAIEAANWPISDDHPIIVQLLTECRERFGIEPYLGGLPKLEVQEVSGRVWIIECDGEETVIEEGVGDEWM